MSTLGGKNSQHCRRVPLAGAKVRIAPLMPVGVSQVASKRNFPLRCTPAGGGSGGVVSTSIHALGGTEAPATGRRPRTRPPRLLPRPLSAVCTLSVAAARRRQVPQIWAFGEELTIALRCTSARTGMRAANRRSIFVDAQQQAASGRPRENAFFRSLSTRAIVHGQVFLPTSGKVSTA